MSSVDGTVKRTGGRERLYLMAIAAVAVAMYVPTFRYLWGKWIEDMQYSLGFLAPLVSGYFVWRKLPEAAKLDQRPTFWGVVLVAFGLVMHLSGVILDVSGPSALSIILVIVGGCLYFHGTGLVRLMAFPLAYLVFAIPVPGGIIDRIGLPMQLFASASTSHLLNLIGLDVSHAGVQLVVDGYTLEVAPACSGMSSLVALVSVIAVFAYLTRLPVAYKWALFALSVPVAVAANIVRITTIALVGYQWGWERAMKIYHDWSSPILFLIAIGFLFIINWGFEWLSARRTTS